MNGTSVPPGNPEPVFQIENASTEPAINNNVAGEVANNESFAFVVYLVNM